MAPHRRGGLRAAGARPPRPPLLPVGGVGAAGAAGEEPGLMSPPGRPVAAALVGVGDALPRRSSSSTPWPAARVAGAVGASGGGSARSRAGPGRRAGRGRSVARPGGGGARCRRLVLHRGGGDGTVHALVEALALAPRRPPLDHLTLGAVGLGSSNDFHKPVGRRVGGVPVRLSPWRAAPRRGRRPRVDARRRARDALLRGQRERRGGGGSQSLLLERRPVPGMAPRPLDDRRDPQRGAARHRKASRAPRACGSRGSARAAPTSPTSASRRRRT